jgi:hypothetical protein
MGHNRRSESVTEEDEEFNRIEREAAMRKEAVAATITKREWVGLTEDEMKDALVSVDAETKRLPPGMKAFAQAIEIKLKEKNGM